MKKLSFVALFCFLLAGISGQDYRSQFVRDNEIGVHLGATTSMGISYRHWFNRFGLQVTALPVRTDNITFISAGATALYSFYESPYVMVFGYVGNHYLLL